MIDVAQKFTEKTQDKYEHFVRKYDMRSQVSEHALEGQKEIVRVFKDHILEVKSVQKPNGPKQT